MPSALLAPLLLAAAIAAAGDTPPVDDDEHVTMFTFYTSGSTAAQKCIANIQLPGGRAADNASEIQRVFEQDGVRTLLSADVFMRDCGNYPDYKINASVCGAQPGWQQRITASLAPLKAQLGSGALAGAFLGDEIWWVFFPCCALPAPAHAACCKNNEPVRAQLRWCAGRRGGKGRRSVFPVFFLRFSIENAGIAPFSCILTRNEGENRSDFLKQQFKAMGSPDALTYLNECAVTFQGLGFEMNSPHF